MAHEKVYGFCENKCKVEVPPKNELVDLIYPVGSIYMSVSNIDPSNLFGGTWERWAHGQVIVGVYEDDADFNGADKKGGEKTHTLTVNEIPPHKHSFKFSNTTTSGTYIKASTGGIVSGMGALGGDLGMTDTGGGKAHNNMPPYITAYIWKRTA